MTDNDHPARVRLFGKEQREGAFELWDFFAAKRYCL